MMAMSQAGMAFTPTHTTRKLDAFSTNQAYLTDERLKYVPQPLRDMWRQDAAAMAKRGGESYKQIYEFGLELTGKAHKAGVTILAGTDAPDSFAFPGSGLHDELEHLVQAGLSPLEALRAATVEPARFLGLEGKTGTVQVGARADLVFLSANPLEDISAVRSVKGVVSSGVYYGAEDINALYETAERNANSWAIYPKFFWSIVTSPIMRTQFAD